MALIFAAYCLNGSCNLFKMHDCLPFVTKRSETAVRAVDLSSFCRFLQSIDGRFVNHFQFAKKHFVTVILRSKEVQRKLLIIILLDGDDKMKKSTEISIV